MSSNGFPRGGRSGRTPHFLTVGLLVVICILAFNYWNVSSQSKILQGENSKMRDNIEELVLRKVHLEKRTEALNKELQENNDVVHDTQEKANTCHASLRELGSERDRLQGMVTEFEQENKELKESLEYCNDTMERKRDELRDLRADKAKLEEQLTGLDSEMALLRREAQTKDERLHLAQIEISHHKSEIEALQQQQQQQQQQMNQYNPNAVDPRQNPNNLPQQGLYQQPQQNAQLQQGGGQVQRLEAISGNQQLPLGVPGNLRVPGNLGVDSGQPQVQVNQLQLQARQQPQVPQLPDNRVLLVPEVPKFNFQEMRRPAAGNGLQPEKSEAEKLGGDTGAGDRQGDENKGVDADRLSDSLHLQDREGTNSTNNEGEKFIQEGTKNEEDLGGNRVDIAFHRAEEDSQPPEGADGASEVDSDDDRDDNPQDPGNGIDDQQSAGKEHEFKFIGQQESYDEEEEEESSESDYDYANEDKKDANKEGLGEVENQVPGNLEDYNALNNERGIQLDEGNNQIEAPEDAHRLKFNPGT